MLHRFPDLWQQIKADQSVIPKVLEETLRYEAPVPHSEQTTTNEIEVGNTIIPPNQNVIPFFAMANRDPKAFDDPHGFDPFRKESGKHLSFGTGPHACLGANLARMIGNNLFSVLAQQFKQFQFEVAVDEIEWLATSYLRGPKRLPVRFER